jgi:hypothetical protein
LNKLKKSLFTKFKSNLLKQYDVDNLCLQLSAANPSFAVLAAFLSSISYNMHNSNRLDNNRNRHDILKADLKKRFGSEEWPPSRLKLKTAESELYSDTDTLKAILYYKLAMVSDLNKAKLAIKHSPILEDVNKKNSMYHVLDENISNQLVVADKIKSGIFYKFPLIQAYGSALIFI